MAQPSLRQQPAGGHKIVIPHQQPPRQHPKRPLNNAHVLVQHQMPDMGPIQQGLDGRNQHDIVGPQQLPHGDPRSYMILRGLAI